MKDVFEKVNTPIIIHNNKFRSIIIQAIFPFDITDSEIGLIDLIPALLVHTSKKYPNETLFLKEFVFSRAKKQILRANRLSTSIKLASEALFAETISARYRAN